MKTLAILASLTILAWGAGAMANPVDPGVNGAAAGWYVHLSNGKCASPPGSGAYLDAGYNPAGTWEAEGPIPEPATLAGVVLGFGAVASYLRRRREAQHSMTR